MKQTIITSRAGYFTSSNIWKLMTNDRSGKSMGQKGLTYIEEKKKELRLGRQLQKETQSRATSWGKFVQHRVTNTLLDLGCTPTKDIRREHPTISNWSGAEDYLRKEEKVVGEVKCFELNNFCDVHDAASMGYEMLKTEAPEVFWQLVSNAILNGYEKSELTLYVPYQKELEAIRQEARESEDKSVTWLTYNTDDDELPYLIEGKHYKNLTLFQFDVKEEDIAALTNKVIMANKLLKP